MDIRAAVLHEINAPMTIETLSLADPGPNEVRVRIAAAGICHSDLHVIKGELRQRLPAVLGHEGAGVIEAVGEGVADLQPGQPIVLSWIPACGECFYCQRGEAHLCANGDPLARSSRLSLGDEPIHHFLSTSAFAEAVVVPASGAIPITDEVPLEKAALVSCSVATGVGAVLNAAKVPPGATVAVFGCGGVGLNVIQAARMAQAGRIIAIDRVAAKLTLAAEFGATDTLPVEEDTDIVAALREMCSGYGPDYAFDAVGSAAVIKTAFTAVRDGGKVVVVGIPPVDQRLDLRGLSLALQEKTVMGTLYGSLSPREHIPRLLEMYLAGDLLLDPLISHTFTLDQINDAFEALDRGELTRGLIRFGD